MMNINENPGLTLTCFTVKQKFWTSVLLNLGNLLQSFMGKLATKQIDRQFMSTKRLDLRGLSVLALQL